MVFRPPASRPMTRFILELTSCCRSRDSCPNQRAPCLISRLVDKEWSKREAVEVDLVVEEAAEAAVEEALVVAEVLAEAVELLEEVTTLIVLLFILIVQVASEVLLAEEVVEVSEAAAEDSKAT